MARKKKPAIDIARDRKLISESLLTDGACLSKPYPNNTTRHAFSSAPVVSVLTERDGAEACEYVLPQTAKAIVAAFDPKRGWAAALDEIERLRKLVAKACSLADDAAFPRADCREFMKAADRIRREAGF